MAGKTLIQIEKPQTQTVDAIKALLSWRGRASDPLPSFLEMGGGDNRLVLVLSNKKDCYYTVTGKDCSCPAAIYHRGPCKHQRKHFAEYAAPKTAPKAAGADLIPRQQFRPFLEDETQPARRLAMPPEETAAAAPSSSSIPLVDCLGEPTPGELAYHSIQADREMWPMVEA